MAKLKIDASGDYLCQWGVYEKRWWGWKRLYLTGCYRLAVEFRDQLARQRAVQVG